MPFNVTIHQLFKRTLLWIFFFNLQRSYFCWVLLSFLSFKSHSSTWAGWRLTYYKLLSSKSLEVLLLNTSVLLASRVSVTWAHHNLTEGNQNHILQALYHNCPGHLFHTLTSLRVLQNIIYHIRWILWLNFLCSHRISWITCSYWINFPCCLFFMFIKISFYIQSSLWLSSHRIVLTLHRYSMTMPLCIYLLMELMFF